MQTTSKKRNPERRVSRKTEEDKGKEGPKNAIGQTDGQEEVWSRLQI